MSNNAFGIKAGDAVTSEFHPGVELIVKRIWSTGKAELVTTKGMPVYAQHVTTLKLVVDKRKQRSDEERLEQLVRDNSIDAAKHLAQAAVAAEKIDDLAGAEAFWYALRGLCAFIGVDFDGCVRRARNTYVEGE